jgi:asparagine synthase (glutamine-hydrolysing)
MAHLVLAIDPNPSRRQRFLEAAIAKLSSWNDLLIKRLEFGDVALAWACGRQAPSSQHADEDGFGLLLGNAIDDNGNWLDASQISAIWRQGAAPYPIFDGYFLSLCYAQTHGLALSVDPLGMFPMYHAKCGSALLAGTSAELFDAHPDFHVSLDLQGLAGILLTNGLVANRTLLAGVRRLPEGCHLCWNHTSGWRELPTYRLPTCVEPQHLGGQELGEFIDGEIRRALHRHRPPQGKTVLMLSGGMDSRLMAGYLKAEGLNDTAITLGRSEDYEVRAATEVAAALSWRLQRERREPDAIEFLDAARQAARWEHLSGGFGAMGSAYAKQLVGTQAPFYWSGYVMDETLGGFAAHYARDRQTDKWSFETFLQRLARWGLPAKRVSSLLQTADSPQIVSDVIEQLRANYERPGELPWQQSYRMKLGSRVRYHIGGAIHRLSFHSWPLLPILDRRVNELLFQLSPDLSNQRQLELMLLKTRFPELARIPLDTNSFQFSALQAKGGTEVPQLVRMGASLLRRMRQAYWLLLRRRDPRRYVRYFDINSSLWQEIRRAAEPHREDLETWLVRAEMDKLLPSPEARIKSGSPFSKGACKRTLLGLMLWKMQQTETRSVARAA